MNRRTSIKSILTIGLLGVSSFSIYKGISYNQRVDFKLLAKKKTLIAELAETIIPRTNTPGAKDAKVEDFILRSLEFCTKLKEQHLFISGLNDLEKYTFNNYHRSYVDCSKSEKTAVLQHFENKATYAIGILNKIDQKYFGKSFFTQLKELTIEGYCISQPGATKGLAYDYIPVTFEASVPLANNQRSWATK